jgi:hypothetical protein
MKYKVEIRPSHVALLVQSVEQSAHFLNVLGFQASPAEEWEGEGTKEIYVERDRCNSLLLMEPVRPGAYRRAMTKRGPGLHHLAIDVLSMDSFIHSIAGSGWLLHPNSIKTLAHSKTAYLARPGFPALIEVQEREKLHEQKPFITKVEIPFKENLTRLLPSIGLEQIVVPSSDPAITLGSQSISLDSILSPGSPA